MEIQMKGLLGSMNETELNDMLQQLIQAAGLQISKSSKMISYKCYECSYVCGDKKANGYGRNEKEANGNCIRNLLEFLLQDEQMLPLFSQYLQNNSNKKPADMISEKSTLQSQQQYSQPNKTQTTETSQGPQIAFNNLTFNNQQQFDLQQQSIKPNPTSNSNTNPLQFYNSLTLQSNPVQSQKTSFSQFASISIDGSKTPQPIHKHSRNKSTTNNTSTANYCSIQLSQDISTQSVDKDTRLSTLEEELKRAKSIISHLERKVKLVIEENKILKSLLVENKKDSANNPNTGSYNNAVPKPYNNLLTSNNNETINNENLPPPCSSSSSSSSSSAANNTAKQGYFISSATQNAFTCTSTQNAPSFNVSYKDFEENSTKKSKCDVSNSSSNSFYGNPNNPLSNNKVSNSTNYTSQFNRNQKNNSNPTQGNQNGSSNNPQQQQSAVPLQILKEYSSKANIILNQQSTPQAAAVAYPVSIQNFTNNCQNINPQFMKPSPNNMNNCNIPLPSSQQPLIFDEEPLKPAGEKFRSLSLDVNGRRSTMKTDNSSKKLDTSYNESTSNQLLGHRRCKSRIPKLNLEVLPNYHGNNNKSINDQLLIQYQNTQNNQATKQK